MCTVFDDDVWKDLKCAGKFVSGERVKCKFFLVFFFCDWKSEISCCMYDYDVPATLQD